MLRGPGDRVSGADGPNHSTTESKQKLLGGPETQLIPQILHAFQTHAGHRELQLRIALASPERLLQPVEKQSASREARQSVVHAVAGRRAAHPQLSRHPVQLHRLRPSLPGRGLHGSLSLLAPGDHL